MENGHSTINSLVIMTTYQCQLLCRYCEVERSNSFMPIEIFERAVDFLFTSKNKECQIRFWGGEPLLRWEFIREGILCAEKKAEKTDKKIRFMITTNGLLIDENKLEFLKQHPVEIMLSFDGMEKTNKRNRFMKKGHKTHVMICNILSLLRKKGMPFFINLVVAPNTVETLSENLLYLRKLRLEKIQVCYQCGIYWKKREIEKLFSELNKFLLKNNDTTELMNFNNRCEPTMLSNEFLVDIDGYIFFDAAIFLEKRFPVLRHFYKVGTVRQKKSIDALHKSKTQLFELFKKSCSPEQLNILINNIELGLKIGNFFDSHAVESHKTKEHPAIIPIIKGNFDEQRKTLKKLMIDPVFLYIDGPCSNNCLFCQQKKKLNESESFSYEIKMRQNLDIKAEKICLIGNEPLQYAEIIKICGLAKRYGFKEIEIMTSGELLANESFVKILEENGATAFSLPIYSSRPKIHDAIVQNKGSFRNILKGIDNLLKHKIKIYAHSNLLKHNIADMKKLEFFIKEEKKIPFSVLPIRPKTGSLSFENLMPDYKDMIGKLKGMESLLGFPVCVISKIQKNLFLSRDEISDSMKLYFIGQKFEKIKRCTECLYFDRCPGFFREYGEIYSLNFIEPFSNVKHE